MSMQPYAGYALALIKGATAEFRQSRKFSRGSVKRGARAEAKRSYDQAYQDSFPANSIAGARDRTATAKAANAQIESQVFEMLDRVRAKVAKGALPLAVPAAAGAAAGSFRPNRRAVLRLVALAGISALAVSAVPTAGHATNTNWLRALFEFTAGLIRSREADVEDEWGGISLGIRG
ncbi:MAG: hypothetical protein AB7L41_00445 [Flavobacteriaceae bacterium]